MKYTVFYSWQSDLPNNTNRGFLQTVIVKAINGVHKDESIDLEISFDRDTQGIPGAPNISQTILEKIKTCDAFISDVSIVTGDKDEGSRLSPNPNVLLELGYAISAIGWDKIILICNSEYGDDEDLPFDIRQHRRISYQLKTDDQKPNVRNDLVKQLKSRLVEILDNSRPSKIIKQPDLNIHWVLDRMMQSPFREKKVDVLKVYKARDIDNVIAKAKSSLAHIDYIEGGIDSNWDKKVEHYKHECSKFIKELGTEVGKQKYLFNLNKKNVIFFSLCIANDGTLPASDIKVEVSLPEWLMVYTEWPSDTPEIPNPPTPCFSNVGFGLRGMMLDSRLIGDMGRPLLTNSNRSSGISIRNRKVQFWADKLLHKHEIIIQGSVLVLGRPDANLGDYSLDASIFCAEYDDWQKKILKLEIVASS